MGRKLNRVCDSRYVKILFSLCWLVYCTSYLGRLNYSSAMTLMISEGVLTASAAGFISMLYFFAYAIGQLINGLAADRINPVHMISYGLVMSAVANLFMGVGSGFLFMAVMWGINGFCQSMIWAPVIRIFAEMLSERDKVNCSVNIASSGVVGTFLSYILSAALMAVLPWNSVFWSAALLLVLVAVIFRAGMRKVAVHSVGQSPEDKEQGDKEQEDKGQENKEQGNNGKPVNEVRHEKGDTGRLIVTSGLLFLLIPVIIHGMPRTG